MSSVSFGSIYKVTNWPIKSYRSLVNSAISLDEFQYPKQGAAFSMDSHQKPLIYPLVVNVTHQPKRLFRYFKRLSQPITTTYILTREDTKEALYRILHHFKGEKCALEFIAQCDTNQLTHTILDRTLAFIEKMDTTDFQTYTGILTNYIQENLKKIEPLFSL